MTVRILASRYELRSALGRGGMAEVWSAYDRRLDREVAVKMMDPAGLRDPSALTRFDREARIVARLSHPNIVAVHDVGADSGTPFLVMELVTGPSVADLLAAGPIEVPHAIDIATQICDALTAAHAAGIIHRDIKPANLLLTEHGQVKVCDFGIARITTADQVHLTGSAQTVGTSAYMAPEQINGEPVDARTDLYALGCVLYAMLTGDPPFAGDNPFHVAVQHVRDTAPPPSSRRPGLTPAVDTLVAQLLAKQPTDRPATATQVRATLARLASVPHATAAPPLAPRAIRASATVPHPTRTMPVLRPAADPAQRPDGLRIGPAGAALVALTAAAVVAISFALFLALRPDPAKQLAVPPTSSPTHAVPSRTEPSVASPTDALDAPDALAALTAEFDTQRRDGQLDAKTARELDRRLDEIRRAIDKDEADKAGEKTADFREKLDEAYEDGKLEHPAYTALRQRVEQLATTLPEAN
ncbi:protein kinase domain-containing protein [Luedemannella helvata]|uniref:non-specific serine/threonine protein kinase n=1 Tax=Luedemannella helvata TaxID=349315 RepID=A0ABN2KXD2_9ACTN